MMWPNNCTRGVDLSSNNNVDIKKLLQGTPSLSRFVLRAGNAFGRVDTKLYGFAGALDEYDIYVWPDPTQPLGTVKGRWIQHPADPAPSTVWLDCEWSAATWRQMTGKNPIRSITEDTRESLRILVDLFPEVGIYTRGNWWDENIRDHGWEKDYKFWIAHYPMWWREGNASRQALRFEELEAELPLNAAHPGFPNLGKSIPPESVVGWQFSDHSRLPGYGASLDLSLWIEPADPKPTVEERLDDHEVRIVALEGR